MSENTNVQTQESGEIEREMGAFAAMLRGRTMAEEVKLLDRPQASPYVSVVEILAEEVKKGTLLPEALVENRGEPGIKSLETDSDNLAARIDKDLIPVGRSCDYIMAAYKLAFGETNKQVQVVITERALTDEERIYYAEEVEPAKMQALYDIIRRLPRT